MPGEFAMEVPRSLLLSSEDFVAEADIRRQVDSFYARVRCDPILAPVFEAAIGPDWGPHLDLMCDFWSGVLRRSGRYKGNPLQVHRRLPALNPALFERWLALFRLTAEEVQTPEIAALFVLRAERIAGVLQNNLFGPARRDPLRQEGTAS